MGFIPHLPGCQVVKSWWSGRKVKIWRVDPFTKNAEKQAQEIPFHVKDTREVHEALRFTHEVAPDNFNVQQLRWVNVAPAGDKVVYSALGHLYLKTLPDGKVQRLTKQTQDFEFFPSFRVMVNSWCTPVGMIKAQAVCASSNWPVVKKRD